MKWPSRLPREPDDWQVVAPFCGADILPGNEDLFGSGVDHARVDRTNVELALYGTEPYNWR